MNSLESDRQTLYRTDYFKWLETTAKQLRDRDLHHLDWENLIEEIEDTGRSERRSLESNLIVVLLDLLKWQYQPQNRSGSWESSIIEHRRRIKKAIQESPSLRPYLESILAESYIEAVKQAKAETGLSIYHFPTDCPYNLIVVIDDSFLPE